jgi:hypothetical protein
VRGSEYEHPPPPGLVFGDAVSNRPKRLDPLRGKFEQPPEMRFVLYI